MPAEEVSRALHAGELQDYLDGLDPGAPDPPAVAGPEGQLSAEDIRGWSAERVVAARKAGKLDHLLGVSAR